MSDALAAIPPLPESGSLVGQVRDVLCEAIISGTLEPGTRLRVVPLSEHFGVSAMPVREALRRLESEGLIDLNPRRGAVVSALDASTVADLYELRLVLESAAVQRAARLAGSVDQIDGLVSQMGDYLDENPQVTFHRLDLELHRAINELSGNTELAATAEQVHRRIQAVRVRCAVPGRLRVAHGQHRAIVAAIKDGDESVAADALTEHITSAKAYVLDALARQGSPA